MMSKDQWREWIADPQTDVSTKASHQHIDQVNQDVYRNDANEINIDLSMQPCKPPQGTSHSRDRV